MTGIRSHSRKDEHRILLPREPGGLDVNVSEGTLERALQVMAQVLAVSRALNPDGGQTGLSFTLLQACSHVCVGGRISERQICPIVTGRLGSMGSPASIRGDCYPSQANAAERWTG